jgi:hypothetical protein
LTIEADVVTSSSLRAELSNPDPCRRFLDCFVAFCASQRRQSFPAYANRANSMRLKTDFLFGFNPMTHVQPSHEK